MPGSKSQASLLAGTSVSKRRQGGEGLNRFRPEDERRGHETVLQVLALCRPYHYAGQRLPTTTGMPGLDILSKERENHAACWSSEDRVMAGQHTQWLGRTGMFSISSDFVAFLRAAKLATYAAQGDDASVLPLLPDSKQLEYSQGRFLYRDIYVGMLGFVGQEVVYSEGRAVWSMSYSGGLLPGIAKSEAAPVYRALRAALAAALADLPLRGPSEFEFEGLRYSCAPTGGLERFHGFESISREGQLLYDLHFTGGVPS
jgi:hypothetical protein